ncbi:hypothetical protein AB0O28_03210 [Microbispora sp. NPDC088329]|uniref:hypothetical protein n=1 Tax=Microbispora sp. NPDC088329 TaxID=3154869 RepID=UPI00343B0CE5
MEAEQLIAPTVRQTEFHLVGFVSDDQLRAAEELRRGAELWFTLALRVRTVDGELPTLVSYSGHLTFPVEAGEWSSQLERVDAGSFFEVLVPMPEAADHAAAVRRLQEARRLLRDNQLDAALGEARKALEPVLEAVRAQGLAKGASEKRARERTLNERFAVLVEDVFSLLSGAAHDDEITKDFQFTRAEALALLATTAGLVNRLAQQQI